jgi:hypothetical protein
MGTSTSIVLSTALSGVLGLLAMQEGPAVDIDHVILGPLTPWVPPRASSHRGRSGNSPGPDGGGMSAPARFRRLRRVAGENSLQALELIRNHATGFAGHNPPRDTAQQPIEQIDP